MHTFFFMICNTFYQASIKLELISISKSKRYNASKWEKMSILTLIKNSFKRYVREELIDFPQDICFVSKRCISIPDLYDILPISNANTDADDLILWKTDSGQNRRWTNTVGVAMLGKNRFLSLRRNLSLYPLLLTTQKYQVRLIAAHLRHSNLQTAPQ